MKLYKIAMSSCIIIASSGHTWGNKVLATDIKFMQHFNASDVYIYVLWCHNKMMLTVKHRTKMRHMILGLSVWGRCHTLLNGLHELTEYTE